MEYSLDNNCISDIKFIELIDTITNEKYKEDIYAIFENKIQFNTVQKKTLDRIIKNKPNQKLDIYDNSKKKIIQKNKNCPHCGHINTSYKDNVYIVCGYTNKGYDLEGCANDWCFGCGKRLCKNWMTHDLFMITNRFHNGKCCKNMLKIMVWNMVTVIAIVRIVMLIVNINISLRIFLIIIQKSLLLIIHLCLNHKSLKAHHHNYYILFRSKTILYVIIFAIGLNFYLYYNYIICIKI